MKSTSSFGRSHHTKLSQFTRKSRRRHSVNSNWLLNGDDSTDKGGYSFVEGRMLVPKQVVSLGKEVERSRNQPKTVAEVWTSAANRSSTVGCLQLRLRARSSAVALHQCPVRALLWQQDDGENRGGRHSLFTTGNEIEGERERERWHRGQKKREKWLPLIHHADHLKKKKPFR